MAVWQSTLHLVPRAKAVALCGEPLNGEFLDLEEDLADVEWWTEEQPPGDLGQRVDALLSRARAWSPDLETWGTEDGDRIDVWRDEGRVVELTVRFDMRSPNESFILGIATLAHELGCLLLSQERLLVDPKPDTLAALLRQSPAMRFVEDPLAFLRRIRLGGPEDG